MLINTSMSRIGKPPPTPRSAVAQFFADTNSAQSNIPETKQIFAKMLQNTAPRRFGTPLQNINISSQHNMQKGSHLDQFYKRVCVYYMCFMCVFQLF